MWSYCMCVLYNDSVSLIIYPGTWGSDQSRSGEYNPPISFAQLTQNVRWSKYHCDPCHLSLTFIYIIWHGVDILIYHKWKVRGRDLFDVTWLSEEHS